MKRIALALAASFLLASAAQAADGRALFGSKCALCHGPDGKGQSTMGKRLGVADLTVTKLSLAEIEATVTNGKGKMTKFAGKLSGEEIKAISAFVKGGLR